MCTIAITCDTFSSCFFKVCQCACCFCYHCCRGNSLCWRLKYGLPDISAVMHGLPKKAKKRGTVMLDVRIAQSVQVNDDRRYGCCKPVRKMVNTFTRFSSMSKNIADINLINYSSLKMYNIVHYAMSYFNSSFVKA